MLRSIFTLCPLFAALSISCAFADDVPSTLPAPPSIRHYLHTMAGVHTLRVEAVATETGKPFDKAVLVLSKPNRFKLVAMSSGKTVANLVSDGHTFTQWDGKSIYKTKAPAGLDDVEPPLDTKSTAADLAQLAFFSPDEFGSLPEYTDEGETTYNGAQKAEKLTASNAHGVKTLWIDNASGLPLRYDHSLKGVTFSVVFSHYQLNAPVTAASFTANPPKKLIAFVPPKDPTLLPVGTMAPDFTLSTLDGKTVHLSDYKGSVVMIDFWASWCPPCKMAMPHVQRVYNDLKDKGFVVLSVNTWDQEPFMKTFLANHPWYTTTMLFDPNPPSKSVAVSEYKVYGIPTAYIINKDGTIAATIVDYEPNGEANLRAKLAALGIG